jgi:hypothetical protein
MLVNPDAASAIWWIQLKVDNPLLTSDGETELNLLYQTRCLILEFAR